MTEKTTGSFAAHARDARWGKDLRPYFAYRDLGIRDATEGKVLAHIIRAEQSVRRSRWAITRTILTSRWST